MSFMLALPKISLHGCGAIEDMVKLLAQKQWGKALIVTDGQLVELGLLEGLFSAMQQHALPYAMFNEVFPNPTEGLVQQGWQAFKQQQCDYLIAFGGGSPNAIFTGAPAACDRSASIRARTASASAKRLALNELR